MPALGSSAYTCTGSEAADEAFSSNQIPIIDLSWPEQQVVSAIARAADAGGPGFFYIMNHGVSEATLDAVVRAARDFYALGPAAKDHVHERFSEPPPDAELRRRCGLVPPAEAAEQGGDDASTTIPRSGVRPVRKGVKGYASVGEKGAYEKDALTDARPIEEKATLQWNQRATLTFRFPELAVADGQEDTAASNLTGWAQRVAPQTAAYAVDHPSFFMPNQWPKEEWFGLSNTSFRGPVEAYFDEVERLAGRMAALFAKVVGGADAEPFPHLAGMRTHNIAHYPVGRSGLGIAEHTDWEMFTLLYTQFVDAQSGRYVDAATGALGGVVGGGGVEAEATFTGTAARDGAGEPLAPTLQVYHKGAWIAVPPVKGAIIVNQGEMLTRWSNGRLQPPLHRVLSEAVRHDRYTLVSFWAPDFHVPLPEWVPGPPEGAAPPARNKTATGSETAAAEDAPMVDAGMHYLRREYLLDTSADL